MDPNSLLYWYPKIKDLVPTPKTDWVLIPEDEFPLSWLSRGIPKEIEEMLKKKAEKIGYPLFMRTDHFSGKHGYENTCYVPSEDRLIPNLISLVELNYIVDLIGLPINAIVLREYLKLDWRFKAFFGKLPIAVEVRWFIRDGKLQCWHFYWVKDAIRHPDCKDWEIKLKEMEELAKEEERTHRKYVEKIAKRFDGYWSVDLARTRDGKWVCIDMALGEQSWHPSSCPHLSEEERKKMLAYERRL